MRRMLACLMALVLALTLLTPVLAEETPSLGLTTYRALLIGNDDYLGSDSDLYGCVNDMTRIAGALKNATYQGVPFARVETRPNQSSENILKGIQEAASDWGIDENDVTVFSYSGHGTSRLYFENNPAIPSPDEAGIVGTDGTWIPMAMLEEYLRQIPGTVVIIMDSCFSGAVIGKSPAQDQLAAYNQSVVDAFKSATAKDTATSSKYHVLTAASGTEVSWESGRMGANAGLFTSSLVKGLGMDYTKNQPTAKMPADKNGDLQVSVSEAYAYLLTQVPASSQHVQMYSESPAFAVYARTGAKALSLNHQSLTLAGWGETARLSATADGQAVSATWSTSNKKVATVSDDGTVTAVGAGKATITARSGKAKATCQITVSAVAPTALKTEAALSLSPGETADLAVTFEPAGATSRSLTYASSDKKIAAVSKTGQVTAVAPGKATITVKGDKGLTASCLVTVGEKVPVTSVSVAEQSMALMTGGPDQLLNRVIFEPANASNQAFTITSSNKQVATAKAVIKNGKPYVQVTPRKAGIAKLNLRTEDGDHSCQILVEVYETLPFNDYSRQQIQQILSGQIEGEETLYLFPGDMYFKNGNYCVDLILFNNTPYTVTKMSNLVLSMFDRAGLGEDEYLYTFDRLLAMTTKKTVKLPSKGLLPYQTVTTTVTFSKESVQGLNTANVSSTEHTFSCMDYDVQVKSGAKIPLTVYNVK